MRRFFLPFDLRFFLRRLGQLGLGDLPRDDLLALVELGTLTAPTGETSVRESLTGEGSNVEKVAESLFTDFLWPFEITSILLVVAALLFTIGAVGLLLRRNVLVMFMCVELMLNAANVTFVTFARALDDVGGQVIVFFTLVVAAAEVAVGLAIIVAIFRRRREATADDVRLLRG